MSVIDDYLSHVAAPERAALERIRALVVAIVPDAQEVISYGMPGFKYKGKYLVGFAVFKDHLSLFPTGAPVDRLKDKLAGYKLSKGTVQFTLDNPVPDAIIKELLLIRVEAIAQD